MNAYMALCVGTSIRAEEAGTLRWDAICLDRDPPCRPPRPAARPGMAIDP